MKRFLYVISALILLIAMAEVGWGQTTIFTETIGTVSSTTTIASHESSNGFDNDTYTMSNGGTANSAEIRQTYVSSGYTGASGLANVAFPSTDGSYGFAIEGIDASSYTDLTIQFGYRKESSSVLPALSLDYWNGSSYINVSFSYNETSGAATGWYLSPEISLPEAAQISGLKLRWVKSGTVAARIDDIALKGTLSSVKAEPSNHVTNFLAVKDGTYSYSRIDLSWTANDGAQVPDGYLIKASTADNVSDPEDGIAISDNTTIGSNSGAKNITYGTNSYEWTGLTAEQTYFFKIYPYTNSGANINYKTDGTVPSSNATTEATPSFPNAWINEIHYDNAGTDTSEGIEVIIENAGSYTLSDFSVQLYNGNDGKIYGTHTLSTFSEGNTSNGFTIYYKMISGIQNGDPDGLALCYGAHVITGQFLSYEGTFSAMEGPASGITSTDIGVSEGSGTSTQSLQLTGSGTKYSDFTWQANLTQTWGTQNNGGDQSLPVSLTSFTVTPSGNSVALAWSTESEIENIGFNIYRKVLGGEYALLAGFVDVPALAGHGSTSAAHSYSYTDGSVQPGATYAYRLADVDYSGAVTWHKEVEVKVEVESGKMVEGFHIGALYPNPFNASFIIPLSLKESLPVEIDLYNVQGQVVKSVLRQVVAAGDHRLPVNAGDLRSGVYFVRITVGNSTRVEKIVLMK